MAKAKKKTNTDAIETLLAEKTDIEDWIEKLNAAGSKTPKAVRAKVQGDYQARFDKVLEELQGFRDDIVSSLEKQEAEHSRVLEVEAAASERFAEAELRHSVGEFDEEHWEELSAEIQSELDDVRGEFDKVESEITKLKGLVALIDEGPGAEEELDDVPEPPVAGDDEIAELDEADAEIADLPERPSQQSEAFDEMAFLKSVTEGEDFDAKRPSGVQSAVNVAKPSRGKKASGKKASGKKVGAQGVEAISNKQGGPSKGKAKKSLKCGECGAKNLPTEWYCERCGSELAAL